MSKSAIAVVSGIVLGFAASKLLSLQYLTLIPWGLTAFILGYYDSTKISALKNGAVYGFVLGFVFMAAIYQGSAPILSRIPFFAIIGLVSSTSAAVISFVGFFLKKKLV